jgi:LPXTG-motif cell wall-anchored protein
MAWRKVTGVLAGAAVGVVLLASPAFAAVQNLTLNTAHKGTLAADFQNKDCGAPFSEGMDSDGWHFIWQQGGSFATANLTFNNGSTDIHVLVAGAVGVINSALGWSAFFDDTGGPNPKIKHIYVFTTPGWTLVDGVGTGNNGSGTVFNLSHTCAGDGQPCMENCEPPCEDAQDCEPPPCLEEGGCEPPCAKGDVCTPTDPGTPTPPDSPTPDQDLPTTGASLTAVIAIGAALVAGGTALLFVRRRRDGAS